MLFWLIQHRFGLADLAGYFLARDWMGNGPIVVFIGGGVEHFVRGNSDPTASPAYYVDTLCEFWLLLSVYAFIMVRAQSVSINVHGVCQVPRIYVFY